MYLHMADFGQKFETSLEQAWLRDQWRSTAFIDQVIALKSNTENLNAND